MALILCIETSTTVCSVALANDGEIVSLKEDVDGGYSHAEQLNVFISQVMNEYLFEDLNAVAISEGPGSYTGLRIGTSAAKGLAYAQEIPLIAINTLKSMCLSAGQADVNTLLIPMIDARRMEVYCAGYDGEGNQLFPTRAEVIDAESFKNFSQYKSKIFFGHGAQKCKEILAPKGFEFRPGIHASAKNMGQPVEKSFQEGKFVNSAYFEPFYLKDFVAGKKKRT